MNRISSGIVLLGLVVGLGCASTPSVSPVSGGAPGAGAADPPSCDALAESYGAAFAEARVCDPSDAEPCGVQRARRLDDPCHCQVGVSPARTGTLDALATQWATQSCRPHGLCSRACVRASSTCSEVPDAGFACGGP